MMTTNMFLSKPTMLVFIGKLLLGTINAPGVQSFFFVFLNPIVLTKVAASIEQVKLLCCC